MTKARRRKLTITANDQRIEAATRRRKKALMGWLKKATRIMVASELRNRKRVQKVAKANPDSELEKELLRILVAFGLADADAAGKAMHGTLTGERTGWKMSPQLVEQITRQKKVRITGIVRETRDRIRRQVKEIMLEAAKEYPKPSINEISRRIRREVERFEGLRGKQNLEALANRAELIARTEAVQSENTGIMEGMAVAGIEEIEWLAHTDGKSGDRHHERMNGKKISLADSRGSDKSKWFQMPSGAQLRYPGDPSGPIGETARCRCVPVPVRRAKRKAG